MMRVPAIFFSLGILAALSASAQSSFLPQNLGPAVNSAYDDINPVVTEDGKTLFFVRVNHPENTYGAGDSEDIWVAQALTDSTWSPAKRISNLNIARYNAVLAVSADGKTILLNGVFNKKGTIWKQRGLSTSLRTADGGWATPKPVRIKNLKNKNSGEKSSGSRSADGRTIVLSFSSTYNSRKSDLYISTLTGDGDWSALRKMKRLNSSGSDDAPFLSADGKTIYFSSDRKANNQFDIYKSTRPNSDGENWSEPKVLNDTINSTGWDSYLRTNRTGSWAYFSSTRKGAAKADIFKVKLFEENPFVVVYGKVVNAKNNKPLSGKSFTIIADGKPIDSLKINFDSASYRAKLPLNNVYALSAQLTHYTAESKSVDVKSVKEFTRREIDLPLTPYPYVLIRGKLLVQDTGLPIPTVANAKVFVDNLLGDSIKIDTHAATYELKLNYGTIHELKVVADRYEALPKKLDLSEVEEYQEMVVDLYVAQEKMAIVSGRILDKKTGKPITNGKAAKVTVEGFESAAALIDTLLSTYELRLPLGNIYTISASAPNYYPLYESVDARLERDNVKFSKDLTIVPIEVGQSIRLNNIFFDPAKATLKSESFAELDRVTEFFVNNPDIKVEIAGHTDNVGGAASNLKLSQNRAQSVADYIIKKGIAKERIVAKGYGLSKPVASNATKEGKAQNRRVEFTILDK